MRAFAPSLLALLLPLPAAAQQRHDSNAPIDFDAGHIDLQDKANRVILTGSVAVRQAEMTLNAQRMAIAYTGEVVDGHPQATRIDASGNVVVRRPDQTATGRYGVYDLNRRLITMLGGVTLHQGANAVNGERLTINLDTGRAVIDGAPVAGGGAGAPGAVQAAPGGRVTGTFSVPRRDAPAQSTSQSAPRPAPKP